MKMLLNVTLPHQPFNAAVKDGTAGSKLNRILEATKPDAVYFTERNSQRGAVLIVDLSDASKLPALVEPWLLCFEADLELRHDTGRPQASPAGRARQEMGLRS